MNKYKIDWNNYSEYPYALYGKGQFGWRWVFISSFKTREEAKAHYEKIAELPVYLGRDEV